MKKTTLVIMAAGLGSRFGEGLKQLAKVGPSGEIIMDYSIHDALEAGFDKIVFIIRKDIEADFKEVIGNRIEKIADVAYAYQELDKLPEGFSKPADRTKPFGTGHAVLCTKGIVDGPFAVINADDYYGVEAFKVIYDFLSTHEDDDKYRYAMVGYEVGKTVTDNGYVSRGVCEVNENQELISVTERTRIEKKEEGIAYTEDDGTTWEYLDSKTPVSMNMWGFTNSILQEIKGRFPAFLEEGLKTNPLKCECYLPAVVSELLAEDKATVTVLKSHDQWHGVTYKEDKPVVVKAIQDLKDSGLYPEYLWK